LSGDSFSLVFLIGLKRWFKKKFLKLCFTFLTKENMTSFNVKTQKTYILKTWKTELTTKMQKSDIKMQKNRE